MTAPRLQTAQRSLVAGLVFALLCVAPAEAQPDVVGPPRPIEDAAPVQADEDTLRLVTPVFSARRVPDLLRASAADEEVAEVADQVIETAPDTSCLVVTDGRRVVYRQNEEQPLIPASTEKLGISTVAVDLLGVDHRTATTVEVVEAPDPNGVVEGDLYLVGGGDPLLVTDGFRTTLYHHDQRIVSDFAQIADELVAAGVQEVRGGVIGDESRYDSERSVPSWPGRHLTTEIVGPLSALRVNAGSTGLSLSPDVPSPDRQPGDPPLLAAETLRTLLEDRGIEVAGGPSVGVAPADATEIARLESPPLTDIIEEIMSWSNNAAAELLVKEIGLAATGEGTTEAGLAHVRAELEERGLPMAGVTLVDGSGLDEGNRLTCDFLAEVLVSLPADHPVVETLSVSGEHGTLSTRMRGTAAEGRVRAKTGTLNNVVALAGYADTVHDRTLTFASIMNIPPEGAPEATAARQDELAEELVAYPRTPDLAELLPAPPVLVGASPGGPDGADG